MLLKVECEPKLTLSISLAFDDGTTKEIDIKKGMYGTFKYLLHGATNTVYGEVVDVIAHTYTKKSANHAPHVPYRSQNYVDYDVFSNRSQGYNCPVNDASINSVDNNKKCVICVASHGRTVKIESDLLLDIEVAYMDSKPVYSPDDDTRIKLMKLEGSTLCVSADGFEWVPVTQVVDAAELESKVNNNYTDITTLRMDIAGLTSKLAKLENAINNTSNTTEDIESADNIPEQGEVEEKDTDKLNE